MVFLFFKSLMFVITISYVCSVTIVNALHPTLPESSINLITNKVTESLITINTGYQPIVSSPNIINIGHQQIINSPNIINIGTQPVTGNGNDPFISDPGTEKRNQARIANSTPTIQISCHDECKKNYQSIPLIDICLKSCELAVKSKLGLY